MSDFGLKGVDELRAKLKQLSGEEAQKVFKSATGAGAKVLREAVISNAQAVNDPETPADIGKNIVQRPQPKRYARAGEIKIRVGVLGGAKTGKAQDDGKGKGKGKGKALPGGDTRHFRLVEFGTSRVAARPFIRPAMDKGEAAFDAFAQRMDKSMDRLLKKK